MNIPDIIQSTLLTMQWLKQQLDGPTELDPRPSRSSLGLDPGDECDCGMCRSRAQLESIYRSLQEGAY